MSFMQAVFMGIGFAVGTKIAQGLIEGMAKLLTYLKDMSA